VTYLREMPQRPQDFRAPLASSAMDLDTAIRTRRTHKAYGPEPVPREVLDELFELARWAPNHNLTNPWRFRVLGPEALAALKDAAASADAVTKLDRAPTLIAASALQGDDPLQNEEDLAAAACAVYVILLAAHARGLASYWRTPEVLRTPAGRAAVGIPDDERVLGLIHLGPPRQAREAPERAPVGDYVTYLP
jgi:nitroreductase